MKGSIMATAEYTVTGMSCEHCERAIAEELRLVPGVTNIEVSAQSGRLVVTSDEGLDHGVVLAAVDEAGYSATRA